MPTLLEEIQAKCSAELIASRDYEQIASAVSTERTKTELVQIADVQAYLQTQGLWWAIKGAANDPQHPANTAASAVLDVANARYERIDMTLPIVGQMLGALVKDGLITQANMNELMAMGVRNDPVSARDVNLALVTDSGQWRL